jgi:hypothetical protein
MTTNVPTMRVHDDEGDNNGTGNHDNSGCRVDCQPTEWRSEYDHCYMMCYTNMDTTTTCCFSCMTVTTCKYMTNNTGSQRSNKKNSSSSNPLNKVVDSSTKKNPYSDQVSLSTPKFMSPLMGGHVSGLPTSKAKPLAKICKSRYFHELLIAERGMWDVYNVYIYIYKRVQLVTSCSFFNDDDDDDDDAFFL